MKTSSPFLTENLDNTVRLLLHASHAPQCVMGTQGKASTSSEKPAANSSSEPGEGIRSLKTSSIFRAVNFELYARPVRHYSHLDVRRPFLYRTSVKSYLGFE